MCTVLRVTLLQFIAMGLGPVRSRSQGSVRGGFARTGETVELRLLDADNVGAWENARKESLKNSLGEDRLRMVVYYEGAPATAMSTRGTRTCAVTGPDPRGGVEEIRVGNGSYAGIVYDTNSARMIGQTVQSVGPGAWRWPLTSDRSRETEQ